MNRRNEQEASAGNRWRICFLALVLGAMIGLARVQYLRTVGHYHVLNLRLQTALDKIDVNGVRAALDAGADPNGEERPGSGYTALMHGVEHENLEIIRLLLSRGADINRKEATGSTALQQARAQGREDIVRVLSKAASQNR